MKPQLKRNDAAGRLRRFSRAEVVEAARSVDAKAIADVDRGEPYTITPAKRIYTIWPSDKDGNPGGRWGQQRNWLVLDVTAGIDRATIVHGPVPRPEALRKELELRGAQ